MTIKSKKVMKKTILTITALILFTGATFAQGEMRLEATLEKNRVSLGDPVYLYIAFYGSQNVPRPEIVQQAGLKIQYVGPASEMSVVNGVAKQSITHTYLVMPLKAGNYALGPFYVDYRGRAYNASPVTLAVTDKAAPSSSGSTAYRPSSSSLPGGKPPRDTVPYKSDRIFLTLDVERSILYLNETVPVTLKVYVNDMGLKDIEYPFYSHEGFSTGEFKEPARIKETVRGVRYDVLVFTQDLYAIKEGDYILGPANISCKMVTRKEAPRRQSLFGSSVFDDDFFSRRFGYETYPIELESKGIPVTVLPFPTTGKPKNFAGAVGSFDMDVSITPRKLKVGDPITVRMAISGKGSLDTVTAPILLESDKFKTYEPQVTKKSNQKIYEQILVPRTDEAKEVPQIMFSYFDPIGKKYETVKRGPFPVEVLKQPESERTVKMVAMPGEQQVFYPEEKIGRDIIHIKDDIGTLAPIGKFVYESKIFWGSQAGILLLFIIACVSYREKERIQKDKGYARLLKAPRKARKGIAKAKKYLTKGETVPFYDTIHKTLQDYMADRFNMPKGSVSVETVKERLDGVTYDEDVMAMMNDVFTKCEMARYAPSATVGNEEEVLFAAKQIMEYLERLKV